MGHADAGPFDFGSRAWEKAVVWALVVYACFVAAFLAGPRSRAPLTWLAEVRNRLRPKAQKPEEAARERRIAEECGRRRVERARFFLILSNLATLYHGPILVMSISVGKLNLVQSVALIAMTFGRSTAALLSSRLTSRAVDAFFCFYVLVMVAVMVAPEPSVEVIVQERATGLVTLLFWGVATLRPWLNCFGFLAVAIAETIMLVLAGDASHAVRGWFAYSVGFAGLLGLDLVLKKSVRMEILAADSENELDAIRTLLDTICDVVVQLDGHLRLKQHAPKLADMLMMRAPGRNLEGEDLRNYMATDSDRAVFAECLKGSSAAAAHARAFHAKMRDCTGSNVDMEFFSVGFQGRDGGQHHILGMREFTDIRPVLPLQGSQPASPPIQPVLPPQGSQPESPACLIAPTHVLGLPLSPPPPPPPPPATVAIRAPRERTERPAGLGTPALAERGDIGSHASSSPRTGSSGSLAGELALACARNDCGRRPVVFETAEVARNVTVNYLLMSWVLKSPPGACCPKHTALLNLQTVVSKMRSAGCRRDFGPTTDWQCPRCGIKADEYRDPRHRRRCMLCKDFRDSAFQGGGGVGGGSGSKTAL